MPTRTVTIGSPSGLHARPASDVSKAAAAAGATVLIGRTGQPGVDASSILMLMSLALGAGEQVELTSDDETGLDVVAELVASDSDAE
ncbi:HPr family phosphocarrier protein [Sanguibacter antarcticus]|uniref:Phosphocarrier protein HPr n=1 Tax=Sanguibacter antarcticus TaxID=372484 RepID=A0A2A9E8C4_9MICO|nr:HPr family phosphocarrier protein [Sanguibacter antarcticus]PFG34811.1 phosphocarrier protein [Sanguibacter antarcticus]